MFLSACESDQFADAPTARAPSKTQQQAQPVAPKRAQMGSKQMPANHPPVAGAGQMGQGGQMGRKGGQMGSKGAGAMPAPPTAGPQGMTPDQFGSVGPLRWQAPEGWKPVKPASQMRLAEYHVAPAQGGEPATMTVFYFGKGGGGSIQANIDRWIGQFQSVEGKPEQSTRTVNGMKVHLVAVAGTYKVGAAMGGGQAAPNWRMRGAIVESPAGNFFFKMTGPQKTMDAQAKAFDAFVDSFKAAN